MQQENAIGTEARVQRRMSDHPATSMHDILLGQASIKHPLKASNSVIVADPLRASISAKRRSTCIAICTGLWQLGPTLKHWRLALSGVECFLLLTVE